MIGEILIGSSIATISGFVGFLISKKVTDKNFDIYTDKAEAKAKAIESESDLLLKKAKSKAKSVEKDAQKIYNSAKDRAINDMAQRELDVVNKEHSFQAYKQSEEKKIQSNSKVSQSKVIDLERNEKLLESLKLKYTQKLDDALHAIEHSAGMTKDEAQQILLKKVEEKSRAEIVHIVRKYEIQAREEAESRSNYILAQATSRFAGVFASERLTNAVHLESDDIKGRIIGKEGRNIKALETMMGVDIIIDDTPKTITVSSFNMYRRAIATKTLELLIDDGRIQPARIEGIFEKVTNEFEANILKEGEEIVAKMDIGVMHPDLMKLIGRLRYRASYGQNALAHTLEVANLAGIMSAEMGGDIALAKRAGLLHDIGKALTYDSDGNHVVM